MDNLWTYSARNRLLFPAIGSVDPTRSLIPMVNIVDLLCGLIADMGVAGMLELQTD